MKTCQASLRLVGRALQRSVQPSVHERRVQQSEHGCQAQPQGEDDMVSAGGASSDSLPGRVIIAVFLPRPARPFSHDGERPRLVSFVHGTLMIYPFLHPCPRAWRVLCARALCLTMREVTECVKLTE